MATYKLGKLKLNLSKAGVAFRWGDGEIKRFPFSLKKTQGEDAADGLDQFDDAYEDGAQDQGYDCLLYTSNSSTQPKSRAAEERQP